MNKPSDLPVSSAARNAFEHAIARILKRVDATAQQVGDAFPLCADPESGVWQTAPDGRWTGGFWAGLLWLAHRASGDRRHADLARAAMDRLKVRLPIDNVLNGLVFHYGAAVGAIVDCDAQAAGLAKAGAEALASHFNPAIGFIPLGHQSGSLTADASGETNIDGVPGMSLLFWASANGGKSSLREVATQHVRRHVELCLRPDGALYQAAFVDPRTGATVRQYSPRGYAQDSTWARAQSWGLAGFAQAYAWTGERYFLEAATRAADWWISNVPTDRVAFWDFKDPKIPDAERDTSATAMTASALLNLGRLAAAPAGHAYVAHACATIEALVARHLTPVRPDDTRAPGMLVDGCWQRNEGFATRHELVWGDYYLLEALLVLTGKLEAPL